jgi:hypothetical protein
LDQRKKRHEGNEYYGLQGYLATISMMKQKNYQENKLPGAGWLVMQETKESGNGSQAHY